MDNRVVCVQEESLPHWLVRSLSGEISSPLRGRLISPISGLGYRTTSQQGITNRRGEFRYLKNERVTFYLGSVELPTASTGATITFYDMGRTPNEPANVVRLLQSLCTENSGGLVIPAEVARHACEAIDFTAEIEHFARQPAVVRLLDRLGRPLLDTATAIETLDAMLVRHIQDTYLSAAIQF